ncbi:MAG: hypothetical protein KDA41_00685, partial [Planctomycetales bacterium]|nr:hypothetical protein [Planctomycetales bacterium]
YVFLGTAVLLIAVINGVAIALVRVWNPSREVRALVPPSAKRESIWGVEHDMQAGAAEAARSGHVDAQLRSGARPKGQSRPVWDNPVLWREVCTWAYGRKVIAIRVVYLLTFAAAAWAVHASLASAEASAATALLPVAAGPALPLLFISLVIVNALAVTSVTNERDGKTLDLLLATDLSPKEFIFGKIGGVLWVSKEMIVLPMLLCGYVWFRRGMTLEEVIYTSGGLAVMNLFVVMLGLHCGMIYANSRTAVSVSLGTVFFLFLGVVTCVLMMVSFSGSFEMQLAPFVAFILGGGVGLFVSLGSRNPSAAIATASLSVPFATFYAIVSFLRGMPLAVFIVMCAAYGFTTAAMLIPAIYEFDVAMGRTTGSD